MTKRVNLSEVKIGGLNCQYTMSGNLEKKDTIRFIYLGFQNEKYSSIIDIKSIFLKAIKDSVDVFEFKKDLKAAFPEMGNKTTISWDKKNYSILLIDTNPSLILYESPKKGDGHISLKKNQVKKLINWIDSIGFKHEI